MFFVRILFSVILAGEIYEKSEGAITCTSITQHIPQTIYLSILSEIKNMVITALCELEKNHGNLDKLGIDISKKKKVQIESENNDINRAVFNISITGESDTKKEKWYSKVA